MDGDLTLILRFVQQKISVGYHGLIHNTVRIGGLKCAPA